MANIADSQTVEGLLDLKSFRTQTVVQATAAATLTLTVDSALVTIFTGTVDGQIIALPDATTLQVGHRFEFHNNSTADVTLQDGAATILHIPTAGNRILAILQATGTVAGVWSLIDVGSSAPGGASRTTFNDFLLDVFHTHSGIDSALLNGGTAAMDTTAADNTYSGSFTLGTGPTVNALATMGKAIAYNNTGLTIKASGQTIEWRVKLTTLSTSKIRYDFKSGLQDTGLVGDPANGIYFQYIDNVNSGAWTCVSRNGSTSTPINSTVTVVAGTWYRLKSITNVAGTSVSFYIDDVFIGTSTINIPTTNGCRLQTSIEKKAIAQTFAPAAVDVTGNTITITGHGLVNTNRVIITSTGTLPSPISSATIYFVVGATANTFQISTSSGGLAVDITTQGTGTHTVSEVTGTTRTVVADWYLYNVVR